MSDIVIRSGGVVEVDTASLQAVAGRLRWLGEEARDIARSLGACGTRLWDAGADAHFVGAEVEVARREVARAADDAIDTALAVERVAQLYETVELLAERAAAAASGDAAAVVRIDRALDDTPRWMRSAAERALDAPADRAALARQTEGGLWMLAPQIAPFLPLIAAPLTGTLDALGRGRVGAHERLAGPAVPVDLRRVHTAPVTPPVSLADAASRIPGGGESRVRVERYAMASGAAQYAVYIAGTQSFGGRESFDMRSNLELYGGTRSASYEAAVRALEEAGADEGDIVHAFGHSQGAMVAERLAVEGGFDTRTVVSFGSPVQAELGADTLGVSVRHTDDPVATLQSGGHARSVGAEGSFVVERLADPAPGMRDLLVPAHSMSAYAETAALVDASHDPRVSSLRDVFTDLGRARSGVRDEFAAERISLDASDEG